MKTGQMGGNTRSNRAGARSGPQRHEVDTIEMSTLARIPRTVPLLLATIGLLSALWACSDEGAPPGPVSPGPPACVPGESVETFRLPFTLEYRTSGELNLSVTCDQIEGSLTVDQGYAFLEAGVPYAGTGMRYRFPETGDLLYTLTLHADGATVAACGEPDVACSVSLPAKAGSDYLVGGVAAYCGQEIARGRPFRLMRLSGRMEPEPTGKGRP